MNELKEENRLLRQDLKDAYAAKKLEDEAWQRMMKTMQTAVLLNELCKQVVDGFMVKACERMVMRLLGGYIHVDPHYKRGTRVIFSIRN